MTHFCAMLAGGLLIHVLAHKAGISLNRDGLSATLQAARAATRLEDVPVDTDCGPHCAAFSLFTPHLPVVVFDAQGYALAYDAAMLWPLVRCAAAIDTNSEQRVCCDAASVGERWQAKSP